MIKAILASAALAFAAPAFAVNLVPNGDFEAGNTQFTSAYGFNPVGTPGNMGEGLYSVVNSAQQIHALFADYGDATTGSGLYFVANGASAANVPVYTSSILTLAAGTYNFSAALSSAFPVSPASLQFRVDPIVGGPFSVGIFSAPATTGIWQVVGGLFTLAAETQLQVSIVNQNTALQGNDFGIDDISVTAVPESRTWALLVIGFAFVGAAARRRQGAVAA